MNQEKLALLVIRDRLWRNGGLVEFCGNVAATGTVNRDMTDLRSMGAKEVPNDKERKKANAKRDKEWFKLCEEARRTP